MSHQLFLPVLVVVEGPLFFQPVIVPVLSNTFVTFSVMLTSCSWHFINRKFQPLRLEHYLHFNPFIITHLSKAHASLLTELHFSNRFMSFHTGEKKKKTSPSHVSQFKVTSTPSILCRLFLQRVQPISADTGWRQGTLTLWNKVANRGPSC